MNKLIAIGALGLAVAAGATYWATTSQSPAVTAVTANPTGTQDAGEFDTSTIVEMSLGAPDAKVTVIEYASYTCPHCANFHKGPFKELKAEYIDNDQIQFIYRDVYFDRPGLWASLVARCDGAERFFGISDMLYNQQKEWLSNDPVEVSANLRRIGKVAGLGDDQIEACLTDDTKAKTLLTWFQQNAEADNVESTPTLVINGEKHSNMRYADLKAIIDEKLAE